MLIRIIKSAGRTAPNGTSIEEQASSRCELVMAYGPAKEQVLAIRWQGQRMELETDHVSRFQLSICVQNFPQNPLCRPTSFKTLTVSLSTHSTDQEVMNTHSQQPNGNITTHSRCQMHLNIQVQLDTNLQAALIALGVLLFLNLVKSLACADGWDTTGAGDTSSWTSSTGHEVFTTARQTALCVVCKVGDAE